MLLLSLAGVADDTIIEDYAATEVFTEHIIAGQKAQLASMGLDVPDFMLHADSQNMEETLAHLHKTYGTAENYLLNCQVSKTEIDILKNKIIS